MERANYNRGRGRGGGGGRRGGRGGRGQGCPTHAAATSQPLAQELGNRQTASYRPPASQCVEPTRRRASAPAHVPDQPQRASGPLPGGDQRGGGSRGAPTYAAAIAQPPAQQSGNRSDYGQIGAYRPPANRGAGPTRLESGASSGIGGNGRGVGGAEAWGGSGKAWGPPSVPDQRALEPLTDVTSDVQSLKISDESHPSSPLGSTDKNLVPVKRPDRGGRNFIRTLNLLVNIFPVKFNPEAIIIHYDVEIKSEVPPRGGSGKISKSTLRMIWDKLCSDYPTQFSSSKTAYDGEKNIFSVVSLPTEKLKVELSDGQNTRSRSYIVTLKPANELNLRKLKDYLSGILLSIPRDILQGMDVVMKENPSRHMISVGRSFYPRECYQEDDLGHGITASRGFQQSLKPTSQGLALGLDYSVLSFLKPLPVIVFLKQHIPEFSTSDFRRWSQEVMDALIGLQVTVTHRVTEQRFTISGLTDEITRDISFDILDPEGKDPPKNVGLVDYFKEKYGMEITYKDIPCLSLGNNIRKNNVPMEFCILVEGQRYPKEYLHRDAAQLLKRMSMALPKDRKNKICEMVQAEDGPCGGDTIQNFTVQVFKNMTPVVGRVLGPPKLRLRDSNGTLTVSCVDKDKCQWNLTGKSVLDGKTAERWALLDFSASDRCRLSA
ncbi:hypothetical protein F0562_029644 [Nyssa sinensis]|uniref:PAZ domain-containing protein n=1 Tax=Nyssa sinensis TaxID=561372 RepID=A0A5J5B3H5_9ASTE|nr:hypothetical protein F0562_029644 [Nyssa sinensis]